MSPILWVVPISNQASVNTDGGMMLEKLNSKKRTEYIKNQKCRLSSYLGKQANTF